MAVQSPDVALNLNTVIAPALQTPDFLGIGVWSVFIVVHAVFLVPASMGFFSESTRWSCITLYMVLGSVGVVAGGLALNCALNGHAPVDVVAGPGMGKGAVFLVLMCYLFSMTIFVRLLPFNPFGAELANLDFGLKYSEEEGLRKDNMSFSMGIISLGHCIQGMAVVFVYPMDRWLSWNTPWLTVPMHIASLGLAVYPVYNTIKRLRRHGDHFALSSWYANLAEWAMGFMLANATAVLLTALRSPPAWEVVVPKGWARHLSAGGGERFWDARWFWGKLWVAEAVILLVAWWVALWSTYTTWTTKSGISASKDMLSEQSQIPARDYGANGDARTRDNI